MLIFFKVFTCHSKIHLALINMIIYFHGIGSIEICILYDIYEGSMTIT